MQGVQKNSWLIKQEAARLGFNACNIAKAQPLDAEARKLEAWLKNGYHGGMKYMENYFDLRIDPTKLVPGAKSVIVLLLNYFPQQQQTTTPKISKYAYGQDYHEVIKNKLKRLLQFMKENIGEVNGRGFVDSAPVLERSWAVNSGLGWVGKNGNLITKQQGSFFFIATLITDIELEYDDAFAKDYCGTCRRCIDACPTQAILEDKVIDGSKCISYFTIELKEMLIPENMQGRFSDWMFGCDTCQDVCPWNRFSTPTHEEGFAPLPEVLNLTTKQWEDMTEETFRHIFRNSPLKRSKFKGIQRNLAFLKQGAR
jgi:epoxyqueuosine reductase